MRAVTRHQPGQAGFTLVEALVAMAVMAILLGIGIPRMSDWLLASRAASAAEFYAEGFKLARRQAVSHNATSRLMMTENANNGQMDWRVDICFPTPAQPCNAESGSWSTTSAAADEDPEGASGFRSVERKADALPGSQMLAQTLSPSGATDVYFTSLGWIDPAVSPHVERIELAPASGRSGAFRPSAVVLTLAGVVTKCDPNVPAHDSRGCPP